MWLSETEKIQRQKLQMLCEQKKKRNFIDAIKGKTFREKEKLLFTSNFSFSLNVFMNIYCSFGGKGENIVGKEEIARYEQFLLSLNVFIYFYG